MCCHGIKVWGTQGSEAVIQPGGDDIVNYKGSPVSTAIKISFLSAVFYGYSIVGSVFHVQWAIGMLCPGRQ